MRSEGLYVMGVIAIAAFTVSSWLTHRFTQSSSWLYVLDHPNVRSLHTRPTPRMGGVAILVTFYLCAVVATIYLDVVNTALLLLAAAGLVVGGVSFIDDKTGLAVAYRFGAHTVAAVMVILGGFVYQRVELPGLVFEALPLVAALTSALFIVWMINLYNFMDGMDGFAGGMAVAGFGTFAIMGWIAGHEAFSVLSLVVAAASMGFLLFNFPPARIFMGDVGSSVLGFLAAVFSLWGVNEGIFPFWIALLVFSPFSVDATVTLIRRLWRREKILQAHKTHYYQRLVQAGWGHRRTVLVEYGIMLGCALTALWAARASVATQAAILAGWALFYLLFFLRVSRLDVSRK